MANIVYQELPTTESLEKWYKSIPEVCKKCGQAHPQYFEGSCGPAVCLNCQSWASCEKRR